MPFIPPLFKDIGKSLGDLCTKKIDDEKDRGQLFTGQVVKFETTNAEGVKISSYTRSKDGSILSCLDSEYTNKSVGATFTLKLNSKTEVEIGASTKKLYDGLKASLTGKLKDKKGKKFRDCVLDLQYKSGAYSFAGQSKVTAELDKKAVKAELSASIGDESGISVGAMYPVKLDSSFQLASPLSFDELSLGVEMKMNDLTCSLLTKPKSELELGFVKSSSSSTTVGGKFYMPADGADDDTTKVSLGLNHQLDSDTSLYSVFDSTGSLKGTLSKKFADPKLTASLTFGMDLTKGMDLVQPVGVAIALGDA